VFEDVNCPNIDDGSCLYNDCAGECGGTAVDTWCDGVCDSGLLEDDCGQCDGYDYFDEDGLLPDGTCNCSGAFFDCTGFCGGSLVEDCFGECGGDAIVDECGQCGGNGIDEGDCDCEGNIEDCAGECGGDTEIDDCGVCGGDGSSCDVYGCTNPNACNYNPEATADDGSCDYVHETYYLDTDGDGLGYGPGEDFCVHPGEGWSINNDDEFPNCSSNIIDPCGECDGSIILLEQFGNSSSLFIDHPSPGCTQKSSPGPYPRPSPSVSR
jgi:hypothetical protein